MVPTVSSVGHWVECTLKKRGPPCSMDAQVCTCTHISCRHTHTHAHTRTHTHLPAAAQPHCAALPWPRPTSSGACAARLQWPGLAGGHGSRACAASTPQRRGACTACRTCAHMRVRGACGVEVCHKRRVSAWALDRTNLGRTFASTSPLSLLTMSNPPRLVLGLIALPGTFPLWKLLAICLA